MQRYISHGNQSPEEEKETTLFKRQSALKNGMKQKMRGGGGDTNKHTQKRITKLKGIESILNMRYT